MKLEINSNDELLVVSPHPDDESIGCGGLLSKFKGHCDVLLVTDGYDEHLDNYELSQKRLTEFKNATNILGVNELFYLHIPEKSVIKNRKLFFQIDFSKYKYIFVPNKYEYHTDHIDTYKAVKKVIDTRRVKAELIEYEIWTTLKRPNVILDVSNVIDEKNKAILEHKSQVEYLDYVEMINGLNRYRGIIAGCDYAEAFYCNKERNKERMRRIKRKIKRFIMFNK